MLRTIQDVLSVLFAHWGQALIGGVILVSAIIVIMGILKKAIIGKIENKLLRKVVLSFTSILLVFPCTAIYFASDKISFDYYWYACALMCVATILTYWLYENTCLRNLISVIGNKVILRYLAVLLSPLFKDEKQDVKEELASTTETVKTETRKQIKKTVVEIDDDLSDV